MRLPFQIKKHHVVLLGIVLVLIALRVPALSTPYHQDENEWPGIVAEGSPLAGGIPHPPLSEGIYVLSDRVFGNENLRMTPFLLSIVNVLLLYVLVRRRFGVNSALWAAGLFAVSYFSILASVTVDTDGQILPFFFLIAAIAYYEWQKVTVLRLKLLWGGVFLGALVFGFMTKLGFIVPAGAFVLDYLYQQRKRLNVRRLLAYTAGIGGFFIGIVLLILASQWLFPDFNLARSIEYWKKFFVIDRNFFQTCIQVAKSIMFTSPLLIALPFLLPKEQREKLSLFFWFLCAGVTFYVFLFDFSGAALDRYLQFVVVPLSVLGGVALYTAFNTAKITRGAFLAGGVIAVVLSALQFLPHAVPALHPKSEWLSRLTSFNWDFLFPFTGGSGPMGFYVSFLMVALTFLACAGVIIAYCGKNITRITAAITLLIVGGTYNAVFIEEYYIGALNGNSRILLEGALEYIENNPEIEKVITFNEIGFYELTAMGKYQRRLYVEPAFMESYIPILREFTGHYLVVEIPRIDPNSMYATFFGSCEPLYRRTSGEITASVYDCAGAITP